MRLPRYVYAIKHNPTGRIYIGSTCNVKERIRQHMSLLRSGKHHVENMQDDFNQYGEDYSVSVLDRFDTYQDREIEYDWMHKYNTVNPKYGYNNKDVHALLTSRKEVMK